METKEENLLEATAVVPLIYYKLIDFSKLGTFH
jgi:hypothetical protein